MIKEISVIVSKNSETLVTAGGAVSINDMTDSKNWWDRYYCEGCQEYHTDFNYDYPVDYVKTGEAYATILDIGLQAEGNFRTIIDECEKIDDIWSRDGSTLLCNHINNNASAVLYYTSSKEKIADVKAEPTAYEYWGWDEKTNTEKLMTEYQPMPVLIFTDGSKVEFDRKGNWTEVDCISHPLPVGIVPEAIENVVKAHYPDAKVVKIERDFREFDVKLNNRVELTFNKHFQVIELDD